MISSSIYPTQSNQHCTEGTAKHVRADQVLQRRQADRVAESQHICRRAFNRCVIKEAKHVRMYVRTRARPRKQADRVAGSQNDDGFFFPLFLFCFLVFFFFLNLLFFFPILVFVSLFTHAKNKDSTGSNPTICFCTFFCTNHKKKTHTRLRESACRRTSTTSTAQRNQPCTKQQCTKQ